MPDQDKPLTFRWDTRSRMLVATVPGILDAPPIDTLDASVDIDVDAYRQQIAPIVAEFKARTPGIVEGEAGAFLLTTNYPEQDRPDD